MDNLNQFLCKLKAAEGHVSVHEGVVSFEDGSTFDLSSHSEHYGPAIERFALSHQGENPEGFTADATRTGDYNLKTGESIYEEVRIGVYRGDSQQCVADVLVGVDEKGTPRVLLSAAGDGDEIVAAYYPLRPAEEAFEILNNR